jgi:hypothetical protein
MQVASTNMAQLNGDKALRKQKTQKKNQPGNPDPSAAPSSSEPSTNASSTTSSEAQRLPPGTIQACEQTPDAVERQAVERRQAFE